MYRKSKKLIVWCLVLSLVLTQMLFTNAAFAAGSSRLSGLNRYETALSVSQSGWTAGSTEYAVLAYGEDFPDALSAAPLAKKYNAPILLTDKAALSAGVLEEINRVGAKNVFIIGGEGVVSAAVADTLTAAGKTVTRLAGASRYETALKVAEQVGASDTVVVANGENYPDALSIAPIAAAKGWPILLTDANAMDAAVKAYIGSKKAFVIGGSGAVSDAVFNGLSGAERVFGADRYATNVAVMTRFAAELSFNKVFLATGENFADALAGAAYAAKLASPMVLVGASLAAATESFIDSKVTSATEVIALGGTAVVPESAITAIGGGTQDLAISSIAVTTRDGRNVRITFNKPVAPIQRSEITIMNKDSEDVLGIDSVEMSSDNMSADVRLTEEAENYSGAGYIKTLVTYVFTVRADGRTLAVDYTRPAYDELRVTYVDAEERTLSAGYWGEDSDGDIVWDTYDYKVPEDVDMDFQAVLGRTLNIWSNEDGEIVKYSVQEETVKYDAIDVTPSADKEQVKLITEDKKYSVLSHKNDVVVFVDGHEVDGGFESMDAIRYDYAKLVYDKSGRIVYINAYNWDQFMVVEKVEDNLVYGYGDELDAEDFAIVKDGKTIAPADLEQGDILFYNEDENDEFAEVYNKTVSGDIESIYTDRITVNGTDYTARNDKITENDDPDNGGLYAKYVNEDGDIKSLDVSEDDFQDIAEAMQDAGEVTVFLDRNKKMVYLGGDLNDLTKTSSYNMVTDDSTLFNERGTDKWTLDVLNGSGEEVSYDLKASDVDAVGEDDLLYATNGDDLTAWSTTEAEIGDASDVVKYNQVVKIKVDKDAALDSVQLLGLEQATARQKTSDNYYDGKKISPNTQVYLAEDYAKDYFTKAVAESALWSVYADKFDDPAEVADVDEDSDDITVTTYGDLDFDYIDAADYYYNTDNEIVAIVVVKSSRKEDVTTNQTVATDKAVKVAGENIYKLPVVIDGAKVSLMTAEDVNASAIAKGDFAEVDVNDSTGKVDAVREITGAARVTTGTITVLNTADKEITFGGVTLRLGADAVIVDATDSYKVIGMTTLKKNDTIKVLRVADNSDYVSVVVRTAKAE